MKNEKGVKEKRVMVVLYVLYALFLVLWTVIGILIYHILDTKVYASASTEYVPYVIEVEPVPHETEIEFVEVESVEEEPLLIIVTEEEVHLMERVVMSEASVCDLDTQFAIATTIVNRVMSEKFPNTVTEVIMQPNAYSTQDNGEPTEQIKMVVDWALKYQPFPTNMFYFRTDHYHDFGIELFKIGNMYFSGE